MGRQDSRQHVARALTALCDQFVDKHVISLASRQDRRNEVRNEFTALGLDMDAMGIRWFDGLRFEEAAGFPNPGVRGCFNSHLTLLKRCAANDRPMLIMEDDVQFNWNAGNTWDSVVASPDDWDIFYFGYTSPKTVTADGPIIAYDGETIGGFFYGIKPHFAAQMVEFMEACLTRPAGHPLGGPMYRDGAFNHYRSVMATIRTKLAKPALAKQFASRSDLVGNLPFYDRLPGLQPFTDLARRVRSRAFR